MRKGRFSEEQIIRKLGRADLQAYFDRVGLERSPSVDIAGLHILHQAQFFSIPFENFDIHLGQGIDLDPTALISKLIKSRRGGYCFELNGLMLMVADSLGFDARPLLARVHLHDPPSGLTHQLNLVTFGDEKWIIDVGFGAGGPRVPLPLTEGVTETALASYRLIRIEPWGWMLQTMEQGQFKDSYSFHLTHVTPADIAVGNHYTSTSPNCHFTTQLVASLPTSEGRLSLCDQDLTEIRGSEIRKKYIQRDSYLQVLDARFSIELPSLPKLRV